jgi:hypothetical protein
VPLRFAPLATISKPTPPGHLDYPSVAVRLLIPVLRCFSEVLTGQMSSNEPLPTKVCIPIFHKLQARSLANRVNHTRCFGSFPQRNGVL